MIKNANKVFKVFDRHYEHIPLEVFGKDPYKTLVSTVLSSRTKDETTLTASLRLFKKAPDIKYLSRLKIENTRKLIYPVGFYKTKALHLNKLSKKVISRYNSEVPNTRKALMSLPGVGRKTANLVLNRAFGKPAIAVDTHVHKISNMLGWVNTNSPLATEKALIKNLPKKYWTDMNRLFVSTGRQYTTEKRLRTFLIDESLIKDSQHNP